MPQVPTLQPNVGLQVGNARLTPPSTNVEAYGYGSAGNALMGLGKVISDEAIARQKRINDTATMQARNNIQMALDESIRKQSERKGENVMDRPAIGDEEAVPSVTEAFDMDGRGALALAMSGLRNDTQRRELQSWFDENYPKYYNKVATYQQQQEEAWAMDTADTTMGYAKNNLISAFIDGDTEGMDRALNEGLAAHQFKYDYLGKATIHEAAGEQDYYYDMLGAGVDALKKESRVKEADLYIDKYKDKVSPYQYKQLKDKIAGEKLEEEARESMADIISKAKNATTGDIDESVGLEEIRKLCTETRMVKTSDGETDLGYAYKEAMGEIESGGDYTAENGTHYGKYQGYGPWWNTYADDAGVARVSEDLWQALADMKARPASEQEAVIQAEIRALRKRYGDNPKAWVVAHFVGQGAADSYVAGSPTYDFYGRQLTWDDIVPENNISVNGYLNEFEPLFEKYAGYKQVSELNQQKYDAMVAEFNRQVATYNKHRSTQLNEFNAKVTTFASGARSSGYSYTQVAEQIDTMAQPYLDAGMITSTQADNIKRAAMNTAGFMEDVQEKDENALFNQVMEDVYAGRITSVADAKARHGASLSGASYAKLEKLFNATQEDEWKQVKASIGEAVKAAIDSNPEYADNPWVEYNLNSYMTNWLVNFRTSNPGVIPDRALIGKTANDGLISQPVGYQYSKGTFGRNEYVQSYPVADTYGLTDNPNMTRIDRRAEGRESYYVDQNGNAYVIREQNGLREKFMYDPQTDRVIGSMYP